MFGPRCVSKLLVPVERAQELKPRPSYAADSCSPRRAQRPRPVIMQTKTLSGAHIGSLVSTEELIKDVGTAWAHRKTRGNKRQGSEV